MSPSKEHHAWTGGGRDVARRPAWPEMRSAVVVIALFALAPGPSPSTARLALDPEEVAGPAPFDETDRLEILNLLGAYSHLADGLQTEAFGRLFVPEAVFAVVPPGERLDPERHAIARSRQEIVAMLRPRHRAFAAKGIQRRHFLMNPLVWGQTAQSARVSVYLQLRTSENGGESRIVGTGRYEGRVVATREGWRISEWAFHSDQGLDGTAGPAGRSDDHHHDPREDGEPAPRTPRRNR